MTRENLITAAVGTDLRGAQEILEKYKIEKLPIVDVENTLVGLITFKDIQKVKTIQKRVRMHMAVCLWGPRWVLPPIR